MKNIILITFICIMPLLTIAQVSNSIRQKKAESLQVADFNQLNNKVNARTVFTKLSALRSSKANISEAPAVINLSDKNLAGTFVLDPVDTNTPDNSGRVIVTASGLRYKRIIQGGQIQVEWYGAVGDGITDDTRAVQNAINDALSAVNPLNGITPKFSKSGTVLVPVGTFRVGQLNVNGSIRIIGQGGGTYAGSYFFQKDEGTPIILLGPDTDLVSNSTVIENMCFKAGAKKWHPDNAIIKTSKGISSNSIYIRNCWFQNSDNCAIWLTQADDVQISGCTFDELPFDAIRLGTKGGGHVSNYTITNNTFFQVRADHIRLYNVQGGVISNNRAYSNSSISTATFVNGADATAIEGLTITGNECRKVPRFCHLETVAKALVISSNTGFDISGGFFSLTGGGIMYGASVIGNSAYSTKAWEVSPITGKGCGLQSSVIVGNTFWGGTPTELAINLPDGRTVNNIIDNNIFTNFRSKDNLANPSVNGQTIHESSDLRSGDLLYYDGKKITRIPKGIDGQFLKMISGTPSWSN